MNEDANCWHEQRMGERLVGETLENRAVGDDGALVEAVLHVRDYLATLHEGPVCSTASLSALREALGRPLPERGARPAQVIGELVQDATPGLVRSNSGRFFGWVIGGTLPAALAADWLTAAWDQNAALHACSPAAAVVEEVAGAWLKDLLGLPTHSSFAFVTGCQMAHVTCLAAAREHVLRRAGWDVARDGLAGSPQISVLASAQRHASIERAVSLLGLGRGNVLPLPTDELGRILPEALEEALANASQPIIVALQAGDIATGAFDRFEELIPIAKAAGAWVHVDGAFGLWARASERFKDLAKDCELADSWATDGHKVLNTPFDCGYAIVAHPEDHRACLSLRASYLTHAADARDQIEWNPDWSRRARGFPTYAALRSLGRSGVADLFERLCDRASALSGGLAALPGAELVTAPTVNQALMRFTLPNASDEENDLHTDAVIDAINRSGEAFFTGTNWLERRVMRVSVCDWRTSESDVERAVAAAREAVAAASAKTGLRQQ